MAGLSALRDLLSGSSVEIAPLLLGAVLRHDHPDGPVAVRLTEVEAYAGAADPGSHGFRGPTARNATMFGPAGHLYVYFVYGMHHCANVVTGPEGECGAVLVRAGEVVEGLDLARSRRPQAKRDTDLAKGPASLCRALGIGPQHDGADLVAGPQRQFHEPGAGEQHHSVDDVVRQPRRSAHRQRARQHQAAGVGPLDHRT